MKITYEFDTDSENFDATELEDIQNARKYRIALWDIQQYLRQQWKYSDEPDNIDRIYERFFEIMSDNGIRDIT